MHSRSATPYRVLCVLLFGFRGLACVAQARMQKPTPTTPPSCSRAAALPVVPLPPEFQSSPWTSGRRLLKDLRNPKVQYHLSRRLVGQRSIQPKWKDQVEKGKRKSRGAGGRGLMLLMPKLANEDLAATRVLGQAADDAIPSATLCASFQAKSPTSGSNIKPTSRF